MRTKMITSGTLAGLQEFLASWIAKDRSKHGHYFTSRVPKMAIYGAFISAPLGHVMISLLQRMFAGRTSLRSKILQIVVSNLIVRAHPKLPTSPERTTNTLRTGLPHPKRRLPHLHGRHRRRPHLPPDPRHGPRGLHARHESLMGHVADRARVRAGLPAAGDVGAVFQRRGVRDRDVHQCAYEEEEAAGVEEEVSGDEDDGYEDGC